MGLSQRDFLCTQPSRIQPRHQQLHMERMCQELSHMFESLGFASGERGRRTRGYLQIEDVLDLWHIGFFGSHDVVLSMDKISSTKHPGALLIVLFLDRAFVLYSPFIDFRREERRTEFIFQFSVVMIDCTSHLESFSGSHVDA